MQTKRSYFLLAAVTVAAVVFAGMSCGRKREGTSRSEEGKVLPPEEVALDIPRSWKLLFVRYREYPEGDIWMARGDGTDQRLLIEDADNPAWSPDRKQIAFFRDSNLWTANADGSNEQQFTDRWSKTEERGRRFADAMTICWDPVEPRITFSHLERFQVTPVGGGQAGMVQGTSIFDVLLDTPNHELRCHFDLFDDEAHYVFGGNCCPAWSPSGEYLAFVRNGDIWMAGIRGPDPGGEIGTREVRERPEMSPTTWGWSFWRLMATAKYDGATDHGSRWGEGVTRLSWSPDGSLLAAGLHRLGGSGWQEIRVLELRFRKNAAGFPVVTVARKHTLPVYGCDPCFSPDGRFLVYREGLGDIAVVTVDGQRRKLLIEWGRFPTW